MGTPESFCRGGLLSEEGKASLQKGGSEKELGGSEKIFGGSEFKLGGSEIFFPPSSFFPRRVFLKNRGRSSECAPGGWKFRAGMAEKRHSPCRAVGGRGNVWVCG